MTLDLGVTLDFGQKVKSVLAHPSRSLLHLVFQPARALQNEFLVYIKLKFLKMIVIERLSCMLGPWGIVLAPYQVPGSFPGELPLTGVAGDCI